MKSYGQIKRHLKAKRRQEDLVLTACWLQTVNQDIKREEFSFVQVPELTVNRITWMELTALAYVSKTLDGN